MAGGDPAEWFLVKDLGEHDGLVDQVAWPSDGTKVLYGGSDHQTEALERGWLRSSAMVPHQGLLGSMIALSSRLHDRVVARGCSLRCSFTVSSLYSSMFASNVRAVQMQLSGYC